MQENPNALIEQPKFRLKTKEDVATALLLVRNTKKIVEEMEKRIKEKAEAIMEEEMITEIELDTFEKKTGEINKWQIRKVEPTVSKAYNPQSVINALGEEAYKFLTVGKTKLEGYLKKMTAQGKLPMSVCDKASENFVEKPIKGKIIFKEIKQ
jgi:hypothetical protein